MPESRRSKYASSFLLACLAFGAFDAEAAFNRQLDYSLNAEANSDEDDEIFSALALRVDDDSNARRFEWDYDLTSTLFKDHDSSASNDQHQGNLDSRFNFLRGSAWWNFDASINIVPIDTSVQIDEFESQNQSRVSTGPELLFSRGLRGSVNLSLLTTRVRFSETDLDSTEDSAAAVYTHPVDSNTNVGVDSRASSLEYADSSNSPDDFDLTSVGLFYDSRTSDLTHGARISANTVEIADGSERDEESFEINAGYRINTFSSLTLTLSDTLQTSDTFNRLPGNLEESQFQTGLIRNERFSIGYVYQAGDFIASLNLATNKIENVVTVDENQDQIDSWSVSLFDVVGENLRLSMFYQQTFTESTDLRENDLEVSAIWVFPHSSRLGSEFGIFVENESSDADNVDDFNNTGLRYVFRSVIF